MTDELQEVLQELRHTFWQPTNDEMPEGLLYHYTGDIGFHGILTSRCIWTTDYRHVNDPSEMAQGQGGPPEPSEIASLEYRCRSDASGYFYTYVTLRGSSFGVGNQQFTYRSDYGASGNAAVCRDTHVPTFEAIGQASGCLSSRQVYADNSSSTDLLLRMVCAGSRDQVVQALFDTVAYANSAVF